MPGLSKVNDQDPPGVIGPFGSNSEYIPWLGWSSEAGQKGTLVELMKVTVSPALMVISFGLNPSGVRVIAGTRLIFSIIKIESPPKQIAVSQIKIVILVFLLKWVIGLRD